MFLKKILKIHILWRIFVRKKYESHLSTFFSGNLVDKYFLTPKQLLYIILLLATLRGKYALDSNRIRIARKRRSSRRGYFRMQQGICDSTYAAAARGGVKPQNHNHHDEDLPSMSVYRSDIPEESGRTPWPWTEPYFYLKEETRDGKNDISA